MDALFQRLGLSSLKITSIRGSKLSSAQPGGYFHRIFPINSRKTRRGKKLRSKKLVPTKNIIQIISYNGTYFIFQPPPRFCSLFITISMNRCTVTDAAQIKCKQHFRPHPPLFITFHAPPDIYLYYHLHTHLPTCFLVLPLHNENIYICIYTSDYILFIISDHEEKGKSMRNSDYMRVYFPSSVVHIHTHPSYSFSALVSYSNDCNLKYFSLYRMRED